MSQYLDSVRDSLRLDPSSETEVISELKTHLVLLIAVLAVFLVPASLERKIRARQAVADS